MPKLHKDFEEFLLELKEYFDSKLPSQTRDQILDKIDQLLMNGKLRKPN